ncbi:MAG: D-sedoheptulose 7-phosphate isomerase [Campylobacter sp.]|nr:D-sedoheptulose 7-phosphate isomerase [Campylobacter sp.]
MQINEMINSELNGHLAVVKNMSNLIPQIQKACDLCVQSLKNGGKILICGNGGSAADAQHFAAELTGRYKTERAPLPAIALTTDTSALTAIGNDYGYDDVFSRQFLALAKKGDLLFGISTSGNSKNVIDTINAAKKLGVGVVGLSGKSGGAMKALCDVNLIVPSDDTPRIQEMHIFMIHSICQAVDMAF